MTIQQAKAIIENKCDGPITCFVLIARATKLVSGMSNCAPNIAADALYELLGEYGYLTNTEEIFETGS